MSEVWDAFNMPNITVSTIFILKVFIDVEWIGIGLITDHIYTIFKSQ